MGLPTLTISATRGPAHDLASVSKFSIGPYVRVLHEYAMSK